MKIATINVNGLKNRKQGLIKIINDNVLDVICIQEVHKIDKDEVSDIEKETSGILFLDTTSGYLGTGILIRRNIQKLQLKHIEINKENLKNRLTHIQITSKIVINILSVYCPANHYGKDNFFYDLIHYLEAFEHQKLILVGDFNFVENIEDRFPKLNKNDKKIRKNFKPQNLNLIDPTDKSNTQMIYTHKDARLDRFYISHFMVGQVLKTKLLPEIADHKMVRHCN